MHLDTDMKEQISRVLGRELLPQEQGNVASLAALAEPDLSDLRTLREQGMIIAIPYALYRVKGLGLADAKSFVGLL
jgi:hypothetical protein